MPMTTAQMEAEILRQKAIVERLMAVSNDQAKRIEALEKQGSQLQLAKIVELLEPLSKHAVNILAVQSGALGVRN